MQNNLGELLALLSFLMPNIFKHDVIETLLEFLADGDSHSPPASAAADASSSSGSSAFQVRSVAPLQGTGPLRGAPIFPCDTNEITLFRHAVF